MVALGCLLLVILPLAGALVGGWISGPPGARWGAGAGLIVALGASALTGTALWKAGRAPKR